MSSCRLVAVSVLVAVLASSGFDRGSYAGAPSTPACSAQDIIDGEPACPASGSCTITKVFTVFDGCVLDFGTRDVAIAGTGELRIDTAFVSLRAGSFTVASGGLVEGNTTTDGGSLTVEVTRDIAVLKGSEAGKIRMSGEEQGGSILLDAGGKITIQGQLHAHNRSVVTGAGGTITLVAGGDITTTSSSDIDLHGGPQAGGGSLEMDAGGRIDIGKAVDASGGEGGSIDIVAKGKAMIRDKLNTAGAGDGGSGGEVYILAEMDVEVNGQILNRGSPSNLGGGDGGPVYIESGFGDVTVRNEINVQGGSPDGGGGDIEISALGSIDVQPIARLLAGGRGIESWGGDVTLRAGLDVVVSGAVDASGGDSGGFVTIDAGRDVKLTEITDVRGTAAGSYGGGSVAIEAGAQVPGNVAIESEGEIDLRGGGLPCGTRLQRGR